MESNLNYSDPFLKKSKSEEFDTFKFTYPVIDDENLEDAMNNIKSAAKSYFADHTRDEIYDNLLIVDKFFGDLNNPELKNIIELIHRSSGFSKYDIENFGFGIFPLIVSYDTDKIGFYINKSLKSTGIIETENGYLKRFGFHNPFVKKSEPQVIAHFISGNVVGYTSILSRIGFPVKNRGAAQILKLPSASSLFPLLYLDRLEKVDPELRKTICCGYWTGGDRTIEKIIIKKSDAINVLSSDTVINDIAERVKTINPKLRLLAHGHKIGIAYIDKQFLENDYLLNKLLDGLVRDISAFDGGACYCVKNIYIQGDIKLFSKKLFEKLINHADTISKVSEHSKSTANSLSYIYGGSSKVLASEDKSAFVKMNNEAEFWKSDELFRYVQVMPVRDENQVYDLIKPNKRYLQTAIVAVPDEKIKSILNIFGKAGISNIHYPGSAALLNVYEEPHDGEFDFLKVRYNYSCRFAATNFKSNQEWLN